MKKIITSFLLTCTVFIVQSQVFQTNGDLKVNGSIKGNLTGQALRVQTNFGTLDLGSTHSEWAHISSDRPRIIVNKPFYSVTGEFSSYDTNNLIFQTNGTTQMTILRSNGNVGIGTATPLAKLHINSGANNNYAAILATSNEGNNLVVSSYDTQPHSCTVFKISHEFSNNPAKRNNGYISFYRGSSDEGGFLVFGTYGTPRMLIDRSGRVGIGTSTPDEMLTVNGKIHAKEVIVALTGPLADYVFEQDYRLKPLHEVEQFVKTNKHLPGIPSAAQVEEKGLSMGEMQNKLLQKVEELTLYIIEQQKQIDQQNEKIRLLENR